MSSKPETVERELHELRRQFRELKREHQVLSEKYERTRAREKAKERLGDISTQAVVSFTPSGNVARCNMAFATLLGAVPEALTGSDLRSELSSAALQRLHTLLDTIQRQGESRGNPWSVEPRDGPSVWLLLDGVFLGGDPEQGTVYCALRPAPGDDATQSLLEDTSHFRTMFYEDPAIRLLIDPERQEIVDANNAAVEFYGYNRQEFQGLPLSSVNPLMKRGLDRALERTRESSRKHFRFKHILKNGEIREVDVFSGPLEMQGRKFVYSVVHDATEWRRAERRLREYSALLSGIMQNSAPMIYAKDRAGRYIYCNVSMCNYLERPQEEILGRTDRELFPEDRAREHRRWDWMTMETGEASTHEVLVWHEDREYYWMVTKFPMRDERQRIFGVCGISTDITERRVAEREVEAMNQQLAAVNEQLLASNEEMQGEVERRRLMEQELREREAQVRGILRAAPVGIGMQRNGVVRWSNEQLAHMLGHTREELDGMSAAKLYPSDAEHARIQRFKEEQLGSHGSSSVETRLRHRDGFELDVLLSFSSLRSGEPDEGVIFSALDVTERNRFVRELERTRDAAEVASRAKGEFVANMSHEIRTPLNGIMGMLQLMGITALTEEQKEYVDTALDSARGLMSVLNDILDFSLIESGKLVLRREPFHLREYLQPVVVMFREQAAFKGLDFVLDIHPDVPEGLSGDPGRLRQVLFNILGNAIKFTHEGEVRLSIYPMERPPAMRRAGLLMAVEDTGIGVPEDKLERVFDTFTQADGSHTRDYQGTGLGLAIVRRLLQIMGGEVTMTSRLGKGTTVWFCVPLDIRRSGSVQERDAHHLESAPWRVLVVEDNRVNRVMLQRFLKKLGATVTAVENGKHALDSLALDTFDVVLMDVQMPVMDGIAATRAIRAGKAGPRNRDVPIAALTAHAMSGDRDRFLDSGMDDYLAKPVSLESLARLIQRLTGKASGQGAPN